MLQAAARYARDPLRGNFDLTEECRLAGLNTIAMEALVKGAALIAGERIAASGVGKPEAPIWDQVETMIPPSRPATPPKAPMPPRDWLYCAPPPRHSHPIRLS